MRREHIRPISIFKAQELSELLNRKFTVALAALSRLRPKPAGLYLASYRYGDLLMGQRKSLTGDYMDGFLPPCGIQPGACDQCKALLGQLGNERPLFIVLKHKVEEFLEDRTHAQFGEAVRFSSNRLVETGQYVNLAEALNALVDSEYPKGSFKAPIRNASAGVRSVYVTAPIGDKELKLALKDLWNKNHKRETDLNWWNAEWKDRDFMKAAAEIGLGNAESTWDVQVLIIPMSWLRTCLYSRGRLREEGKDFLLQLLELGWKESRGLRSASIRQLTLSEAGASNSNANQIVNRLLLILRGDAPGFRPAILSDENLPIAAIWQTLVENEPIRKRFFADRFPGIIEPFHINRRESLPPETFFYYPLTSFEHLGHPSSPADELDTMEAVDKLLRALQNHNPEMLGHIKWEFFASPAPLVSKANRDSVAPRVRNALVSFTSAEASDVICRDFLPQLKSAQQFGPVPDRLLSRPPRKGFLRRFIRISVN